MIPFDDERYKAAGLESHELEKASTSCRDAGIVIGLVSEIIRRDQGAIFIDADRMHLVEPDGVRLGGSAIELTAADGTEIALPYRGMRQRESRSYGAAFMFEYERNGATRDAILVPRVRAGDTGYFIAVNCSLIEHIHRDGGQMRYLLSIGPDGAKLPHDAAVSIEPPLAENEVPSDEHVLRLGGERIRIGDIVALERVDDDCCEHFDIVVGDGRHRRWSFGELDR